MAFELYTRVALKVDLPEDKLKRGDLAVIVDRCEGKPGQETGYVLEVFDGRGDTLAVVIVAESQIEYSAHNTVPHVRTLDAVPG